MMRALRTLPTRPLAPLDTRPTTKSLWAMAAFAGGWLVLAWPWLSGRFTIPWDAKAQFLPQVQFMAASLARGESPFWNPFVFSGHPQIADPQSMLFSPPFVVLALLNGAPGAWAVDAAVFVAILLGGLALILWASDEGWHPTGCVITALAFGFGAAMAWRIQHTGQVLSLATLPIVLLLLDRALQRGSLMYGLGAGTAAAFLVLGRDQVGLLSVYLLAAYVVWRLSVAPRASAEAQPNNAVRRAVGPLLAAGLVGLAIIAIPILLTLALADQSNRPMIDVAAAGQGSLHPVQALTLFAPDLFGSTGRAYDYWGAPSFSWHTTWGPTGLFLAQNMGQLYIGAIPALLILIGLGNGTLLRGGIAFFTVSLVIMTLYALGWYTPFFGLAHSFLPGVDLYRRPADAVFLIGFLGAVVAGYSAHVLLSGADHHRGIGRGTLIATLITVTAFATCLALAVAMNHVAMATRPLLISAALFVLAATIIADALWIVPIRPILASVLLVGATVADLAIQNGPGGATALPPDRYEVLEPRSTNEIIALLKRKTAEGRSDTRRDRVELAGLGFHWPNAAMTHGLESTLGYNPVRLRLYSQATGAGDNVGLPEERKFSTLMPSYRSQLADVLGLRYIATGVPLATIDPAAQPVDFPLIAQTADGYVYENPRAFPRVVFASSAAPADFDLILNTGTWPDEDLHTTVLLSREDETTSGLIATRGKGTARIAQYANTEVVITVDSTRGGYVVLNDLWHPWWTATLDASPVAILRANVLFRAVRVPPGHHTVRFTFRPLATLLGTKFLGSSGPAK